MHGRPGPSVRRKVRGARRGPERACAGRRARLLPRPHLAETAAQWRRPWPLHVPSPTCSLTWTASCWVGSLRPLPARAVRGRRGRGEQTLRAGGRGGAVCGTPGPAAGAPWPRQASRARVCGVDGARGTYFRRPRRAWGTECVGAALGARGPPRGRELSLRLRGVAGLSFPVCTLGAGLPRGARTLHVASYRVWSSTRRFGGICQRPEAFGVTWLEGTSYWHPEGSGRGCC